MGRSGRSCGSRTGSGNYYDAYTIENNTGMAQTLTITATWPGGDGYLHVYRFPFNSTVATFNCVDGDDDRGGDR